LDTIHTMTKKNEKKHNTENQTDKQHGPRQKNCGESVFTGRVVSVLFLIRHQACYS